jgi:hypothetical protein
MFSCDTLATINSGEDLADFLRSLRESITNHPQQWKNVDLEQFFDAMAAWIRQSNSTELPDAESWRTLPTILCASRDFSPTKFR